VSLAVRVRFAETDQMRVAHHSAYIVWLEAARIEWLRERGLSYRTLEDEGVSLAVSAISVMYHQSSRFDDMLRVEATMTELRSRRVRFRYVIRRGETKMASGDSLHTPVDSAGRVTRLPRMWLESLHEHLETP